EFTIGQASKLGSLVKFQRAMLYVGLTGDLSNGVILSYETFVQLRDVDAAMSQGTLNDYQRIYGTEEGRRRWETERFARILGVLGRAAVNGWLIGASAKGAHEALG